MRMASCPKHMEYGPCGGVRNDLGCEVDAHPCPFVDAIPTMPPQASAHPTNLPRPCFVVDVRAPADWTGDEESLWHRTGELLDGCVALIGEHVDNPVLHDDVGVMQPERVIAILREHRVPVIATVTGRDRDVPAARATMQRFRAAGASLIHCVTGDHPAAMGIDRPANFGAESMSLIAAATGAGIAACVGESPASPGDRAGRLAAKGIAGASLCILNHSGDVTDLVAFADRVRAAGSGLDLVAPVPMVADKRSALGLASFPGLRLPVAYLDTIIDAVDPAAVGLDLAARFAGEIAASTRFVGVNLSGRAAGDDPWERLDMTARFIDAVRSAWVTASAGAAS